MNRLHLSILTFSLLLVSCGPQKFGVQDIWALPGSTGGTSAIYFVVNNPIPQEDTLLSVSTDIAKVAELRMTIKQNDGTASMFPQKEIPIPANSKVIFQPGGLHVGLSNLTKDLKTGDQLSVSFTFQKAGEIKLDVKVKSP